MRGIAPHRATPCLRGKPIQNPKNPSPEPNPFHSKVIATPLICPKKRNAMQCSETKNRANRLRAPISAILRETARERETAAKCVGQKYDPPLSFSRDRRCFAKGAVIATTSVPELQIMPTNQYPQSKPHCNKKVLIEGKGFLWSLCYHEFRCRMTVVFDSTRLDNDKAFYPKKGLVCYGREQAAVKAGCLLEEQGGEQEQVLGNKGRGK